MIKYTAAKLFRELVYEQGPVQIAGTINAFTAILAKQAGFKAIYLSGAGVANASLGLPDLGVSNLNDVLTDIRRITESCSLPLLVDADTGWGSVLNIARTSRSISMAGAAGMHLEDQVMSKRCGHRPGKQLVSTDIMCDRLKAAIDHRYDNDFVVMARTDAYSVEGLDSAIERAGRYVEAGADMIFAEAVTSLSDYEAFVKGVNAPILANITEFGRTPLFTADELGGVGVGMILYPLSAFRAMNRAASMVYTHLLEEGGQEEIVDRMQTRDELYDILNYEQLEALVGGEED